MIYDRTKIVSKNIIFFVKKDRKNAKKEMLERRNSSNDITKAKDENDDGGC